LSRQNGSQKKTSRKAKEPTRRKDETHEQFSHRLATFRGKRLEAEKAERDKTMATESPLDRFARVWESA
jgi:hypothetical protein